MILKENFTFCIDLKIYENFNYEITHSEGLHYFKNVEQLEL